MKAVDVCIVGGGPAGMILALLLCRRGLRVQVLERNCDFEREFRGEVLQPRFWRAVDQVGLLSDIQQIPHETFDAVRFFVDGVERGVIQTSRVDSKFPYLTWMTQPQLLNGLWRLVKNDPNFSICFSTNISRLIRESSQVCGVVYDADDAHVSVHAKVVVGADGRFSALRKLGGFELEHTSHQFDVMWFEMDRPDSYRHGLDVFFSGQLRCLVLPKYPHKIQCGILIKPGTFIEYRRAGTQAIADMLNQAHPMFREFSKQLVDFQSFTLLAGSVERLREWAHDGILMIGDAAHTCSPAGAIGVTIATETAIVADAVIAKCIAENRLSRDDLGEVQRRRIKEVKAVHRLQERAGDLLFVPSTSSKWLRWFVVVMVRSGLAPVLARRLLTRKVPLPVE